jgi:hypothetical protein
MKWQIVGTKHFEHEGHSMAVDQATRKALELKRLKKSLPNVPPVLRVDVQEYVDSEGDDALRVTVVLPDDTPDEQLTGENVWAIKSAIYDSLEAEGIQLFPYIFLASDEDLSRQDDDDEE